MRFKWQVQDIWRLPVFSAEMVEPCWKTVCIRKRIVCKKNTSILVRLELILCAFRMTMNEHDVQVSSHHSCNFRRTVANEWALGMIITETW